MGTDGERVADGGVNEAIEAKGLRPPDRRARFRLALYDFLHPFGVHHNVRIYAWNEEMGRLIDLGIRCRGCMH